jgi:hypothetical protein
LAVSQQPGPRLERELAHDVVRAVDLAGDDRARHGALRQRPKSGRHEHLTPQLLAALLPSREVFIEAPRVLAVERDERRRALVAHFVRLLR